MTQILTGNPPERWESTLAPPNAKEAPGVARVPHKVALNCSACGRFQAYMLRVNFPLGTPSAVFLCSKCEGVLLGGLLQAYIRASDGRWPFEAFRGGITKKVLETEEKKHE